MAKYSNCLGLQTHQHPEDGQGDRGHHRLPTHAVVVRASPIPAAARVVSSMEPPRPPETEVIEGGNQPVARYPIDPSRGSDTNGAPQTVCRPDAFQ
jgi:hypothetical protein